ncbi:succinylglutamate desuccinylase/aspartoacylase family protein [Treponema sp. UBA3813]|uniref:M14 family metallopeptidase n=1 Tax=Treponema sp. UBA3813 TaxID=1947715 RepID=UPI0025DB4DBA|nr:succinylglutamate desuccinylase/aspartoacylase family protein [Treponema sp. UBA3813]
MTQSTLYEIKSLYRDNFRVTGFSFGQGEKSVCVVGSMRGNEYQQIYACSRLIERLRILEEKGKITSGKQILVIPCANPYSVNVKKRFWTIDNTDINRMFPGYNLGETTQRIADGIFSVAKEFSYGIQFASFYMSGNFVPQVRMMKTGHENVELAKHFGLPYVVLHNPRPFDTATLNYNWQIWETDAFSLYTTSTSDIDRKSAAQAVDSILNFLSKQGIIDYKGCEGYISRVVESKDFVNIRSEVSGFFETFVHAGDSVERGQLLAKITDPYTAALKEEIRAGENGIIAFAHSEILMYQNTAAFKLIREEE